MSKETERAIVEATIAYCIAAIEALRDHYTHSHVDDEHDLEVINGFAQSVIDSLETIEPDFEADSLWSKK